jgi:hypothetical protein
VTELVYRVHGVATVSRPVRVMFQGDEIDATIEGVEVDLVPVDDPTHGSITWRFVGRDAIDARAEFSNGALGTISRTPARP